MEELIVDHHLWLYPYLCLAHILQQLIIKSIEANTCNHCLYRQRYHTAALIPLNNKAWELLSYGWNSHKAIGIVHQLVLLIMHHIPCLTPHLNVSTWVVSWQFPELICIIWPSQKFSCSGLGFEVVCMLTSDSFTSPTSRCQWWIWLILWVAGSGCQVRRASDGSSGTA